jgi:RNA-directed DNA polymerase
VPGSPHVKTKRLPGSDDDFRSLFRALTTRDDIASLLDVPLKVLTYHVLGTPDSKKYRKFSIKKASGGDRQISAPTASLKVIQQKLNQILNAVYAVRQSTHGFVRQKNIVTNARIHARSKFVFNVDILDFFPSVNFGRVRGMFMSKPYGVPAEAATFLAQICCFENGLPQGAPTSPIISNMVCARLDGELQRLARLHNCLYSRYADDITFSTRTNAFPKAIGRIVTTPAGQDYVAGGELEKCVADNGFQLNRAKTRLQTRMRRQEVTGLTTNQFPNVTRAYLNQVRAMLYSWKKFGEEHAEAEFRRRHDTKQRNPSLPQPAFRRVVKGKLDFLAMIRGKDDLVCLRFYRQFAALDPKFSFKATVGPRAKAAVAAEAVWVLESSFDTYENGKKSSIIFQGSAFVLDGIGVVTCAHVIHPGMYAIHPRAPQVQYPVTVVASNDHVDLALLKIPYEHDISLRTGDPEGLEHLDPVTVLGFPNYSLGQPCSINRGEVTSFRVTSGTRRVLVSARIVQGNSGGPVLDRNNRVIGVAVTGLESEAAADVTEKHGVIPIDALRHLDPHAEPPRSGEAQIAGE